MNADWAMRKTAVGGFEILSQEENRGWILLPNGTAEATVGQARTAITLPNDKVVPILFELLPNCYVPVVLGQEFVFEQQLYTKYEANFRNISSQDQGDELMPMGFRKKRSEGVKTGHGLIREIETDDLERQLEWNLRYQHGRKATPEEWDQENSRRERYERSRDPTW
jgi:hypothetical protein